METMTLEQYNKTRADLRRQVFGRDDSNRTWVKRPTDAFNAGYDMALESRVSIVHPAYDPSRPNHFFHDSAGDPENCMENHNHPRDIGE